MVDERSRRGVGRVVLAVAGDDDDWTVLRDFVSSLGWLTDLVELSVADDELDLEGLLPPLEGVDAALVVLSRARGRSDVGGPGRLGHLGMLVGLLHGRLGSSRVLVLAETDVAEQVTAGGIEASVYRRGAIDAHQVRVEVLLADAARHDGGPRPFANSRLGRGLTSVAPELWLVLGPLLVLGSVLAVLGLGILNWRSSGGDEPPAVLAPAAPGADASSSEPGVPGTVAPDATVPAGMSIDLLPVSCVIDIPDGASLPVAVPCEDRGQLRVDGYLGPWRDEIALVGLGSGVVGTAELEAAGGSAGAVQLAPGREQALASEQGGRPRVHRIELIFGADGQQVVLRQAAARGGRSATFTFSLG
ncbi:MAG: hypothetical protein OEW29_01355 [Acidimicrobiia bacterium]|nr:hypothetical protein [Acidimicrobiia bacterium]MDH4365342.1 hypothetical protein [Acidimicrobiia bacterium]